MQVLPEIRKRSIGESLAGGFQNLGRAVGEAIPQYLGGKEKKRVADEQYRQENESVRQLIGRDISGIRDPVMRQKYVSEALQGIRKQQEIEAENKAFTDIFGSQSQDQSEQPGAHGFKDQVMGTPDLSNITDEQLAQYALKNPQKANALRPIVQSQRQTKVNQNKLDLETLSNNKFGEGYKALLSGDKETFNKVINDPKTPYDVKTKLSALETQHATRKSVEEREKRTRITSVAQAYQKEIAAQRSKIGKYPGGITKEEIKEINDNIKRLEALRNQDLNLLKKNPDAYFDLSIWGSDAAQYLREAEGQFGAEGLEDFEGMGPPGMTGPEGKQPIHEPTQTPMQGQKIHLSKKDALRIAQELLDETGDEKTAMKLFDERYTYGD
jgi:hypothetical protein